MTKNVERQHGEKCREGLVNTYVGVSGQWGLTRDGAHLTAGQRALWERVRTSGKAKQRSDCALVVALRRHHRAG
jgi:hypothetical protein